MAIEKSLPVASDRPDFKIVSTLRFDVQLLHSSANTILNGSPSPFYMLPYHRDRILQAATHFNWTTVVKLLSGPEGLSHLLKKLVGIVDVESNVPLRVRILVDSDGKITIETKETSLVPLENLFPSFIPPPSPKMKVSALTGGVLMLGADDSVLMSGPGHRSPQQREPWVIKVDKENTKPSSFTTYKTTCRGMYDEARGRVGIQSIVEAKEVLLISDPENQIMEGSLSSVFFWRHGKWVTPPVASGGQTGTSRRWLITNGLCVEESVSRNALVDGEECWISNGVRGLICGKISL